MDSRTIMNYLILAVIIAAANILVQVAIFQFCEISQIIWMNFIIFHLAAGLFLGYAGMRAGNDGAMAGLTLLIPVIIILGNMILTVNLAASLKIFSGSPARGFVGAVTAMALGFGIPLVHTLTSSRSKGQVIADGPPPDIKITDIILEETGIRCPICYIFPEEEGHYIIRCFRCNAEFCSKHLEENEDRCWRCRTPIPFIKQVKLAVKENLNA